MRDDSLNLATCLGAAALLASTDAQQGRKLLVANIRQSCGTLAVAQELEGHVVGGVRWSATGDGARRVVGRSDEVNPRRADDAQPQAWHCPAQRRGQGRTQASHPRRQRLGGCGSSR